MGVDLDNLESEKTCFVICPIGKEGSATRAQSDELLEYVIKPAAKACGLEALRADEDKKPGLITRQIIEHIRNDRVVVADLSGHNPNVLYELALRHVTQKPVIQMIEEGQDIPFDLKDVRTIRYNRQHWAGGIKAQKEIVQQIEEMLKPSFEPASLPMADWRKNFQRIGDSAQYLKQKRDASPEYNAAFERAKVVLEAAGISVGGFFSGSVTPQSLAEKIRKGCRVRLVLLHPHSVAFELRAFDERQPESHHIKGFSAVFKKLQDLYGILYDLITGGSPLMGSVDVFMTQSLPYFSYFRADDALIVGFYNRDKQCNTAACIQIPRSNQFFGSFTEDFHGLCIRDSLTEKIMSFEGGGQGACEPKDAILLQNVLEGVMLKPGFLKSAKRHILE